jgi:hypothetical protein
MRPGPCLKRPEQTPRPRHKLQREVVLQGLTSEMILFDQNCYSSSYCFGTDGSCCHCCLCNDNVGAVCTVLACLGQFVDFQQVFVSSVLFMTEACLFGVLWCATYRSWLSGNLLLPIEASKMVTTSAGLFVSVAMPAHLYHTSRITPANTKRMKYLHHKASNYCSYTTWAWPGEMKPTYKHPRKANALVSC